jgi:hypothetical protein
MIVVIPAFPPQAIIDSPMHVTVVAQAVCTSDPIAALRQSEIFMVPISLEMCQASRIGITEVGYCVPGIIQNPTNTGSGCKRTPQVSNTFFSISSLSARMSFAVAPPRFTMASVCFRDIPTGPIE